MGAIMAFSSDDYFDQHARETRVFLRAGLDPIVIFLLFISCGKSNARTNKSASDNSIDVLPDRGIRK